MTIIIRVCLLTIFCSLNLLHLHAQTKIKKLPPNINRPSINLYAPFISGDGQTIVYLSDYTDDGHHSMRWSMKKTVSTWHDELEVNKLINRPTLNYRGGYSLSFDGDLLLFTSRKSGLGGYDLWYSKRRGTDWEAPSNFGGPVNSRENEGAPMLSPDGEYLYFMRCEKMSEYGGASGCRLMISKKSNGGWKEPYELPANINTGNSQTPRILADGETLIFASDQFGGKGGLDLFMTTKDGDTWSDPVPMDFINTEKDDQFISIPAKGRYLYADIKSSRDNELVQILIPDEFKPKKVMRIQAEVVDALSGEPLNAQLTVFNIGQRDRLWNEKIGNKGEFAIVLKEGAAYDVAVDTDDPAYMYYSRVYDLKEEVGPRDKENLKISLSPIQEGRSYPTEITFKQHFSELHDNATFELRRIANLLRKNPDMKIEIAVHQSNYKEDSIQNDPDLSEVIIDTIIHQIERPIPREDSSSSIAQYHSSDDEGSDYTYFEEDSYEENVEDDSVEVIIEETDTVEMEIAYESDSTEVQEVTYEIIEQIEIRYTYHNNRTEKQGASIMEYLIGRGIENERIEITTTSAKVDPSPEGPDITVEMKVLKL